MAPTEEIYFDPVVGESSQDSAGNSLRDYVFMIFTCLMQFAVLFYHMFNWGGLNNQQRSLWVITFSGLQLVVGYTLSIKLTVTIPWIIFESMILLCMMQSKINNDVQDHCILLLAEINTYIWIVYGDDLLISIIVPIICEVVVASADTKFNIFQLRSGLTYCICKLLARSYVEMVKGWTPRLFLIYSLIPLGMVVLCNKYQLLKKYGTEFWFIHTAFHLLFWIYIIFME